MNRHLDGADVKSCIPEKIAELFREEGREEREEEIRRECLIEKLDLWLDFKRGITQDR